MNRAAACRPPVSSNARWAARSRSGRARITGRATTGPVRQRVAADGDLVDGGLAADPARRGRHEMPLRHGRVVERPGQAHDDRVVGLAERQPGRRGSVSTTSGPSIRPSVRRNPTASSASSPGRAHRDGHGDRFLTRTGGADLERRLADDAVAAHLERRAAHRHDRARRDVARRRCLRLDLGSHHGECTGRPPDPRVLLGRRSAPHTRAGTRRTGFGGFWGSV